MHQLLRSRQWVNSHLFMFSYSSSQSIEICTNTSEWWKTIHSSFVVCLFVYFIFFFHLVLLLYLLVWLRRRSGITLSTKCFCGLSILVLVLWLFSFILFYSFVGARPMMNVHHNKLRPGNGKGESIISNVNANFVSRMKEIVKCKLRTAVSRTLQRQSICIVNKKKKKNDSSIRFDQVEKRRARQKKCEKWKPTNKHANNIMGTVTTGTIAYTACRACVTFTTNICFSRVKAAHHWTHNKYYIYIATCSPATTTYDKMANSTTAALCQHRYDVYSFSIS